MDLMYGVLGGLIILLAIVELIARYGRVTLKSLEIRIDE